MQENKLEIFFNNLQPSINSITKEIRLKQVEDAIKFINDPEVEKSVRSELEGWNKKLAEKNYQIYENKNNEFVILGRDNAYDETYSERFSYFVERSNDKKCGQEALEKFIKNFSQLQSISELIDQKEIKLIDIGAGDATMVIPAMRYLNRSKKAKYIAVERNNKLTTTTENNVKNEDFSYQIYGQDFRKILSTLEQEPSTIVLASHLYTTTAMNEFLPMICKMQNQDAIAILIHDTNYADSVVFRSKFKNLLKLSEDYTDNITSSFEKLSLKTITTYYESTLTLPELKDDQWKKLSQIKQADYRNDYQDFTQELRAAKNLIEFILSERLEAFTDGERNEILNSLRIFFEEKNYQLKSTCKIQVALSPTSTEEFKYQFLRLKSQVEDSSYLDIKVQNDKLVSPQFL